ncbi:hypothetical protein MMC34_005293 [Xylographa carneopallida]|nr:hypothetical protein [Xylographa carneopallida]
MSSQRGYSQKTERPTTGRTGKPQQPTKPAGGPSQSLQLPRAASQRSASVSFNFRIDSLSPNWAALGPQQDEIGRWIPPFHWNAYHAADGNLYRWRGGRITHAPQATPGAKYSSVTVFTQYPDTQHFLAVPFDARTQNVVENNGWRSLGFHHVEVHEDGPQYSELDFDPPSPEHHLVAPGPSGSSWVNELFTEQYRHNINSDPNPPPESAGLIGKLTLILALVAFVRPLADLHTSLTAHVAPRQWLPYNLVSNGLTQYRGMVVTIWLDRQSDTTADVLRAFEQGEYGPIFR